MKIFDGGVLKVIEFEQGIVILNALDNVPNVRNPVELVMADPRTLGEVLLKYLHLRSKGAAGMDQMTAIRQACVGHIVVRRAGERQH